MKSMIYTAPVALYKEKQKIALKSAIVSSETAHAKR